MTQQTAVEWLFSQIPLEFSSSRAAYEKLEQAMQMQKEHIILAADKMKYELIGKIRFNKEMKFKNGEEYYNETYGDN